jgi:hypothetical protein
LQEIGVLLSVRRLLFLHNGDSGFRNPPVASVVQATPEWEGEKVFDFFVPGFKKPGIAGVAGRPDITR